MKVIVPSGSKLNAFESEVKAVLERNTLSGYALMGFSFTDRKGPQVQEIDAVVFLEPGVFVCIEAKGYRGKWTGDLNSEWLCDGETIDASGRLNPYGQVIEAVYKVKRQVASVVSPDLSKYIFVSSIVVAPDTAEFEIRDAVVNQISKGKCCQICNITRLEPLLRQMWSNPSTKAEVKRLGMRSIVASIVGPLPELSEAENEIPSPEDTSSVVDDLREADGPKDSRSSGHDVLNHSPIFETFPPVPVIQAPQETSKPTEDDAHDGAARPPGGRKGMAWLFYSLSGISVAVSLGAVAWFNRPCEGGDQFRSWGQCYKDLTKSPLTIGVVSSAEDYTEFAGLLAERLGNNIAASVVGGEAIDYKEAQSNIAAKEWDIVFGYSPVISMRAADNGYKWIARMFPTGSPTIQSAIFSKAGSNIRSLSDIKPSTRVALGDLDSSTSLYLPAYDLYGKSMTVFLGNRASKIRRMVEDGTADVGAGVYSVVKDSPKFQVIAVSREIPGGGVYVSPRLSPTDRKSIQAAMFGLPPSIQRQANYGAGKEPAYGGLRAISLRVDKLLSCANFDANPARFFCDQEGQEVSSKSFGRISSFKIIDDSNTIELLVNAHDGRQCVARLSPLALSQIPSGVSPRQVIGKNLVVNDGALIEGAKPCVIKVTSPSQISFI